MPVSPQLRPCPRCRTEHGVYKESDKYGAYDVCLFCGYTREEPHLADTIGDMLTKRKGFTLG